MALDAREQEIGKHSLRVAFYGVELARLMGIKGKMLEAPVVKRYRAVLSREGPTSNA